MGWTTLRTRTKSKSRIAKRQRAPPSEALPVLERARSRDPFDPRMLRDLATAHARLGQPGLASVAAAERYAVLGRMEDAGIHAERASAQLPRGSAGWLRAQDILAVAPRR